MDCNKLYVMKNRIFFLFILLITIGTKAQAQTTAEWLQQKKTQKKYLMQQIAALQMQLGYVKKGYSIAKDGLNLIGDLKEGEFDLHKDYFNSLKTVNPRIRHYSKIADIVSLQVEIVKTYKNTLKFSEGLTPGEIRFAGKKFELLLNNTSDILNELLTVTSDGKLEMKDDERIKNIDKLYNAMLENAGYAKKFSNEIKGIQVTRKQEKIDIQTSHKLHGIKN